jgi:23S rRNA (uridine2552-2'-O)-methyltransferase
MAIVDLGCAPGSWLQFLAEAVGPSGVIAGYDLATVEVAAGSNVRIFAADVFDLEPDRIRSDIGREVIDALVSDMAPKLTGIRDADQARSIGLAEKALSLAEALVRPDGAFVAKVFQGRDMEGFTKAVKASFSEVKILKPEATREGSREAFVIAKGRRGS